jgi:hypothetical protein
MATGGTSPGNIRHDADGVTQREEIQNVREKEMLRVNARVYGVQCSSRSCSRVVVASHADHVDGERKADVGSSAPES